MIVPNVCFFNVWDKLFLLSYTCFIDEKDKWMLQKQSFNFLGGYRWFPKNRVVYDEGENLGEYKGKYPQQCRQKCDSRVGCNSFTFCTASSGSRGTCHLKGRVLNGMEATKLSNGCTSSYLAWKVSSNGASTKHDFDGYLLNDSTILC